MFREEGGLWAESGVREEDKSGAECVCRWWSVVFVGRSVWQMEVRGRWGRGVEAKEGDRVV